MVEDSNIKNEKQFFLSSGHQNEASNNLSSVC
jgi:hypothetical protein